MAGQTPLVIDSSGVNHSVPDHFQDVVVNITGVGAVLADADDFVIYYAERDTVVDAVFMISSVGDPNDTFGLKRITSGQDPDSAGTAFTNLQVAAAAYTPYTLTITETENYIPAGSMVALNTEIDTASVGNLTIQMRLRTRVN